MIMAKTVVAISDPKTGKSYTREVTPENLSALSGRKVGDEIDGIFFDLAGYKMKITGGSTVDGFPMRKDLPLPGKRRILLTYHSGQRKKDGLRRRLTVRGSQISSDNTQINVKIIQYGPNPIEEAEKDKQ